MEMKKMDVCDGFPPLSSKYPWLVAQSLDDEKQSIQDLLFYTVHNELTHYRCRIPELIRERIRGCFHGWMILPISYTLSYAANKPYVIVGMQMDVCDGFPSLSSKYTWDKEVVIKLMLFGRTPLSPSGPRDGDHTSYLKGFYTKLFYISIFFQDWGRRIPIRMFVFESDMACIDWEKRECLKYWDISDYDHEDEMDFKTMDMSSETWKVIDDLQNATLFVDLARDHSVSYTRVIASDAAGAWRALNIGPDPHTICFPTFYGRDLYALCKEGELLFINNLDKEDYSWKFVEAEAPKESCTSSTHYFLTNCDQHLLLVRVGEYGGHVEVFKCNESTQKWEKIDSVGKHVIFVCGTTCLCVEAKVPKMENKIFFPRLRTKNRKVVKVVFYSLDTCKYHTFNGENIEEHDGGFFGTTYYLFRNAWIEPSWS
nr:hypothetical protein CTI12_AA626130 [Tanacetum cinerariifolium]